MYPNFSGTYNTQWESQALFFLPSTATHIGKCLSLSPAHLHSLLARVQSGFSSYLHTESALAATSRHPGCWAWQIMASCGTYSSLMYTASLGVSHSLVCSSCLLTLQACLWASLLCLFPYQWCPLAFSSPSTRSSISVTSATAPNSVGLSQIFSLNSNPVYLTPTISHKCIKSPCLELCPLKRTSRTTVFLIW